MKSGSISANLRVCVVGAGRMGADHIERQKLHYLAFGESASQ
jgi:hypothetical protein